MLEFVATRPMLDEAVECLGPLFAEPLRPVNPKAQSMVPVPDGLDLEVPFAPPSTPRKLSSTTPHAGAAMTVTTATEGQALLPAVAVQIADCWTHLMREFERVHL